MTDLPILPRAALGPPRWISFDCYGTLINWQSGITDACRELLRMDADELVELFPLWEKNQWGKLHEPYVPYTEILTSSLRETVEVLGYSCRGYILDAFVESLARWKPFPDVNPGLNLLSQRYRLAIISNTERVLLGKSLRHLTARFDCLITAEDARTYKPDPEMFRYALKKLECLPQEVVHVAFGAEYDLAPAASLGIRVVYLNRNQQPRPELSLEGEIQGLGQLPLLWQTEDTR